MIFRDCDGDTWFSNGEKAALWESSDWLDDVREKFGPLQVLNRHGEFVDETGDGE